MEVAILQIQGILVSVGQVANRFKHILQHALAVGRVLHKQFAHDFEGDVLQGVKVVRKDGQTANSQKSQNVLVWQIRRTHQLAQMIQRLINQSNQLRCHRCKWALLPRWRNLFFLQNSPRVYLLGFQQRFHIEFNIHGSSIHIRIVYDRINKAAEDVNDGLARFV